MLSKSFVLFLVYAEWCGHCVRFLNITKEGNTVTYGEKSDWEKLKTKLSKEEGLIKEIGQNIELDYAKMESTDLEKEKDAITLESSSKPCKIDCKKASTKVIGYPTIMLLKEENGVFVPVDKILEEGRDEKSVKEYIIKCVKEECKITNIPTDETGDKSSMEIMQGGKINYRNKYKKYKLLYRNLLNKQKLVGGNNYKNKYLKYKKLYLQVINK